MSEQEVEQPVEVNSADINKAVVNEARVDQYDLLVPTERQKNYMLAVYIAYAVGIFIGLGCLVGVIIAYVKRGDMRGTVYASHMDSLIKTFWITFILDIISFILLLLVVGYFTLFLVWVWYAIRVVSGMIKFLDAKPASGGWILG